MTETRQRSHISVLLVFVRVTFVVVPSLIAWLLLFYTRVLPPMAPGQFGVISFLYVVVLIIFCNIFSCFEIGYHRIRELSVWYALALFATDLFALIEIALATHCFGPVLQFLFVWIVQSVAGLVFVYIFTARFYKLYPQRHICAVIQGTQYELDTLNKLSLNKKRYIIDRVVNQEELVEGHLADYIGGCNTILAGDVRPNIRHEIIKLCFEENLTVLVLPDPVNIIFRGSRPIQVYDTLMYLHEGIGLTPSQRFFKRCIDVIGSIVGILLSIIPMGVCALIIKVFDKGPAFYKQDRYTLNGRVFKLTKLRSMREDAEKDGARLATQDDERITPIGKFIRRTRLDETPQFFNVLAGDMSLVGPRAERPEIADKYALEHPAFAYRLKVKAGMTGYAQINGQYNSNLEDKLRMDIYYIEHYAFYRDISMLFETVKLLFASNSTAGYSEMNAAALLSDNSIDSQTAFGK